jgi:hypothetical protein
MPLSGNILNSLCLNPPAPIGGLHCLAVARLNGALPLSCQWPEAAPWPCVASEAVQRQPAATAGQS